MTSNIYHQIVTLAIASACLIESSEAFSTSSSSSSLLRVTTSRAQRIQSSDSLTINQKAARQSAIQSPTISKHALASIPSSSSRRTTALNMGLTEVSAFYADFPLQSAVLTCGVKASVADVIAQLNADTPHTEEPEDEASGSSTTTAADAMSTAMEATMDGDDHDLSAIANLEWRRNLAYIIYGGIFVGMMCHLEYDYAFPFMFARNGVDYAIQQHVPSTIVSEILFDNFISGPLLWLPPAYLIKAVIYDYPLKEGLEKYVHDVTENGLLKQYWRIWLPAQTVSFSVVPEHLRVAFMACISFFWFILFSSLSAKKDEADASDAAYSAKELEAAIATQD